MILYLKKNASPEQKPGLLNRAIKEYMITNNKGILAADQDDFEFRKGVFGKPYVAGLSGTHFSVSHSGPFWACLLHEGEVGLDIEFVGDGRRARDFMKIARRFFAQDEIQRLELCGGKDKEMMFYRIWTRKEAYVKYLGRGIGHGLSAFSAVEGVPDAAIRALELPEPLVAAYCIGVDSRNVKLSSCVYF